MASAACEQNEILLKKGYSWSREETLLLISLYEEKKEMFQNVNYKKKQVWEVIAAIMQAESVESGRNISPRADQCEGKWKALTLGFRKCEDHNSQTGNERRECPFYKELSEVYGYRPNVRPYATASSSGQGDSLRCPENDSAKSEKSSDDDVKERTPETSTATKKRKTVASSSTTPKKPRLGSGGRNECLAWFKDYAEQKRVEQEAQREKAEKHHRDKMELLSGILGVLKDLNKWIPALETGFYFARQFLNNILLHMDYKVANVQQVTFICWNLLTDILKYYFKTKDIYYMLFIYLKWNSL